MINRFKYSEFYSDGLDRIMVIDRFIYKGRGRPKKSDYIPLVEAQKKLNKLNSDCLDMMLLGKWEK